MKDEKKYHGAVDKSSSERQFCKSDAIIPLLCEIWSHTPSASGYYNRLADKILVDLKFSMDHIIRFSWSLTKVYMYGVIICISVCFFR